MKSFPDHEDLGCANFTRAQPLLWTAAEAKEFATSSRQDALSQKPD